MARKWRSIISYEDRGDHVKTSRWALEGIVTKEGSENTDMGLLWLKTSGAGATKTFELYKDDGCASANKVATGTADTSGCNNTGENSVEVTLAEAESSGISGAMWVHQYEGADTCPVIIALCQDEDLDALYDDIDNLAGFDSTNGMAEFIRVAGEDVLSQVMMLYRSEMGGHGAPEGWFITDAERAYPDLRRIANPAQLRLACAHRALAIGLGRSHQRASATEYSELRDYHQAEYERALASLVLALKAGSGDNASDEKSSAVQRMERA